MNMKNNCRFPEEKRQLFLLFLLKLITLRYVDLLYREILTREHSLFKASAVRTIALVLNDIEELVTVVALGHTGEGPPSGVPSATGGNSSSTYCGMTRDNSPTSQTISLMAATLFSSM